MALLVDRTKYEDKWSSYAYTDISGLFFNVVMNGK